MGSGSSKKKLRHVSTSNLLQLKNDKLSRARRSISFPSYLASIEGNVEKDDMFLHKKALEDFPSHIDNLTSKTTSLPLTPNGNTYAEFNDMNSPQKLASFSEPFSLPPRVDDDGDIVEDAQLWSLAELYNTLIAESWQGKPQLERDSYLLLLDCRSSEDYKMDHIVTARHHTALHTQFGCLLDVPGQLESFDFIVIYGDGNSNIKEVLQNRNLIFYVLNLPYQTFRSKYPFLCTVEIANTLDKRKEIFKTWPSEILDKCIYQGTAEQALDDTVIQGLGITHIINVTLDHPNAFPDTIKYMRIRLDDVASSDLLTWLPKTTKFISAALNDW
ncbi:unnamed protein product [Clavelina lepadiformis]|uniref:Rhodanese domain-containing protein n=1 Tax=Clavelina lepadiformis TaxID=159417 RepID=A0ABP0FS06_CLALP